MTTLSVGEIRRQLWIEKIVINKWFWIIFCSAAFSFPLIRAFNRDLPPPPQPYFKLPAYALTNEMGQAFGSEQLKGRAYLANFMFTSCPTTCPGLMQKMQKVQKRVKGLGTKVAIVTFTVNPENDTPEVLFKHARKYQANPYVWSFLTGTKAELQQLLVDGFKVPMGEQEAFKGKVDDQEVNLFDIAHTEKIVLVDAEGQVRGYYSTDEDGVNRLMIDLGLLVNTSKV